MRRLALLAVLLLAGCAAPAATREPTFRFAEVVTDVRSEADDGVGICGFASLPEVDEANRTVTFHGDWPGRDHAVLVLFVAWDRSGCGTATAAWAVAPRWGGTIEAEGRTIEMPDEQAFRVDGRAVPAGGQAAWTEEGTLPDGRAWTADVTVRDLGDWPRAGLRQAE